MIIAIQDIIELNFIKQFDHFIQVYDFEKWQNGSPFFNIESAKNQVMCKIIH